MDIGVVVFVFRNSIMQLLMIAMPVLAVGMLVGLVVSIIQATTSIQEQTLTFVPKIIAILLTLAFLGPWIILSMQQFTLRIINMIPQMVR